jgi:hypothetical protein
MIARWIRVNPLIRACAWLLVAAWVALTIYTLFGPTRIWWAPLVCLVWAGPALLYVLPPAKRDDRRRDHIVFRSTLPDDPPEAEDTEPLPYGRPALEAIRAALVRRGSTVSPVEHTRFYAWSIDVDRCEVLIQGDGHELLAIAHGRGFEAIVAAIAELLNADSRFSAVEVLTARGYEERGRLPRATASPT